MSQLITIQMLNASQETVNQHLTPSLNVTMANKHTDSIQSALSNRKTLCPQVDIHELLLNKFNLTNASNLNEARELLQNKLDSLPNANLHAEEHADLIEKVADVGYTASLISLILAVLIFTCVKRLRCPKNSLHLQLFFSFIIRCIICQVQHRMLKQDIVCQEDAVTWICKTITVIWHYSLLANYMWILMEGIYLHSLLFQKSLSPYGPSILGHIIFGWVMPILCVTPWILVKQYYENDNQDCWLVNNNPYYFWILRAPITMSIFLNFLIYIRIVVVLYTKLFSSQLFLQASKRSSDKNYKKLLRSTLILIPLFGVHYTGLFIFEQYSQQNSNKTIETVWLYVEQIFSSSQGFIVASLYCHLNGEVHKELKRLWTGRSDNSGNTPSAF